MVRFNDRQVMKKHGSDCQRSVTASLSAVTGFISLQRCAQWRRWRMVREIPYGSLAVSQSQAAHFVLKHTM